MAAMIFFLAWYAGDEVKRMGGNGGLGLMGWYWVLWAG